MLVTDTVNHTRKDKFRMKKLAMGFVLLLCLTMSAACLAEVDWSQWDFGETPDESLNPVEYAHQESPPVYQSYVSAMGFLGGVIPWDSWTHNGLDYVEYGGWTADELSDYLYFLRKFGYLAISDIQLNNERTVVLTMEGTADLPPVLTLHFEEDAQTLVLAVDERYDQTHSLETNDFISERPATSAITVLERRIVDYIDYTVAENQFSSAWYPQSQVEEQMSVSMEETEAYKRYHLVGDGRYKFLAVHIRVENTTLVPWPNHLRFYMNTESFALHLSLCVGVEEKPQEAGTLFLTGVTEESYSNNGSYWVIFPMNGGYCYDKHQMFICITPSAYLDPALDLMVEIAPDQSGIPEA